MRHRGEIASNAIIKSGMNKTEIARRLGISRKTLYNNLEQKNLSYDFIINLYEVLKRPLQEDFPELSQYISTENPSKVNDRQEKYNEQELAKCREELENWKNKAIYYMEKYAEILEENKKLQSKKNNN